MLFAAKVTVPAAALMLAKKNNADPEKQANVEEGIWPHMCNLSAQSLRRWQPQVPN